MRRHWQKTGRNLPKWMTMNLLYSHTFHPPFLKRQNMKFMLLALSVLLASCDTSVDPAVDTSADVAVDTAVD